MPLRMQSSITSNLEIRHRLLNSMKRPRDTSHNVHRNSPCPSATPVGDKASLHNFTDRFTHGTTKCLWTWKMSVSQRNYSKPAGGWQTPKNCQKWFIYCTSNEGTWCGRLSWYISDHFGGDFPHVASFQGKALTTCMGKFRAYNASSNKTFLHLAAWTCRV